MSEPHAKPVSWLVISDAPTMHDGEPEQRWTWCEHPPGGVTTGQAIISGHRAPPSLGTETKFQRSVRLPKK
jgi:hypothetical protein